MDFRKNILINKSNEGKMSYELMFQKAVELQQAGAFSEAEKLYRQCVEYVGAGCTSERFARTGN